MAFGEIRGTVYSVKSGDTLYKLAQLYNTTVEAIVKSNPHINFRNIAVGQKIIIPQGSQIVEAGEVPAFSKEDLRDTLRELWEQHVAWTRMTIISAASDNPDFSLTAARLMRNPTDMANALKPFYGEKDASRFGELIKEHLEIASALVDAAKAGDSNRVAVIEKQWYSNADEIADFLNSINPYISADSFKKMLYEHLTMTEAEAVARLHREYAKDIALYDEIENEALKMADAMSDGIIKQFAHE